MKEVKIPREEIWLVILLGKLLEQQDIVGYQSYQKELEYVQLQEQTEIWTWQKYFINVNFVCDK